MSIKPTFRLRRIVRPIVLCSIGLCVILALNGATRKPKRERDRPWFNATRGVLLFPLGNEGYPQTGEELVASLASGWGRTPLSLPPGRKSVSAVGAPPSLKSLVIDLSGSSINPKVKNIKPARHPKVEGTMSVQRMELRGEAIRINDSLVNVGMTADDAVLDLRRDRAGNPQLSLTEAASGELTFSATRDDIEELMLAGARQGAGRMGLSVQSVRLSFVALDDRTLDVRMRLGTKFTFIGAGLNFTARVAVDDDMNARLTNLTCTGDDVLGPIIVNFIRPGLAKVNNKQRPIVTFPDSAMKLRDLRFNVDESLHVRATFGRG
jgi:hypothetical protein